MKCATCINEIKIGQEAAKRAEYREQTDGTMKIFGANMPDGSLDKATGRLVRAKHQKCYWSVEKKERRAREALARTQSARAADPGQHARQEENWREPVTREIEALLSESDGDA
jgi:hypothetical protein